MSYTVNWITGEITIPASDLTLVSGTRYQLAMSTFLAECRRLEWVFSGGLWAPHIVDHTDTKFDFSGANYAPFDEVLSPYFVTFSAPATRVDLIGSNNNIVDVVTSNGISIVPSNSAGLITTGLDALKASVESLKETHPAYGNSWFWDYESGNDTNSGDRRTSAFKTFAAAHAAAEAGDTIVGIEPTSGFVRDVIAITKPNIHVRCPGDSFWLKPPTDVTPLTVTDAPYSSINGIRISKFTEDGTADVSSTTTTIVDVGAQFITKGAASGQRVRNLADQVGLVSTVQSVDSEDQITVSSNGVTWSNAEYALGIAATVGIDVSGSDRVLLEQINVHQENGNGFHGEDSYITHIKGSWFHGLGGKGIHDGDGFNHPIIDNTFMSNNSGDNVHLEGTGIKSVQIGNGTKMQFSQGGYGLNLGSTVRRIAIDNSVVLANNALGEINGNSANQLSIANDNLSNYLGSEGAGVTYNSIAGRDSSAPLVGTRAVPCKTETAAHDVADNLGLQNFYLENDLTITVDNSDRKHAYIGDTAQNTVLTIGDVATYPNKDVTGVRFKNLTIQGELDAINEIRECVVLDIQNANGFIYKSTIHGTVVVSGTLSIEECWIAPTAPNQECTIDFNGLANKVIVSDWSAGRIRGINMVTGSFLGVAGGGGQLMSDTSNTGGALTYGGAINFDDTFAANSDLVNDVSTAAQAAKKVWDEVLSGTTHNVANSSGKRLRELAETVAHSGSIDDVAATTSVFKLDVDASTVDNFYNDQTIIFIDNGLQGQARVITSYIGTTREVTLDEPLTSAPINGTGIQILSDHVHPVTEIANEVWSHVKALQFGKWFGLK